jgi:hypothetical protein
LRRELAESLAAVDAHTPQEALAVDQEMARLEAEKNAVGLRDRVEKLEALFTHLLRRAHGHGLTPGRLWPVGPKRGVLASLHSGCSPLDSELTESAATVWSKISKEEDQP